MIESGFKYKTFLDNQIADAGKFEKYKESGDNHVNKLPTKSQSAMTKERPRGKVFQKHASAMLEI